MKPISTFLLYQCLLATTVLAIKAPVYLKGPQDLPRAPNGKPQTLTKNEARLVFAQRLGLSEFHSLQGADQATIQVLNTFGGSAHQLFHSDEDTQSAQVMVLVEGIENASDILPDGKPAFEIDGPPDNVQNAKLLADLHSQASYIGQRKHLLEAASSSAVDDLLEPLSRHSDIKILQSEEATFIHVDCGSRLPISLLRRFFENVYSSVESRNINLIIALMPLPSINNRYGAKPFPAYGPYKLAPRSFNDRVAHPGLNAPEHSRPGIGVGRLDISPDFGDDHVYETTVEPAENLRPSIEQIIEQLAEGNSSKGGNNDTGNANNTAPAGILPACFSSISTCNRATHSCSGHGKCVLKYNNRDGDGTTECYACACGNTTRTNKGGGKKTTYWAGPACQKADVSMPFWLLGGLTVLLIFIVSWGIGLLYEMGEQDLPSVIGAGVAGPTARK